MPIVDYVNLVYGYQYNEKELDATSDKKAEIIKRCAFRRFGDF